tara:strand:+ start:1027 stop:1452 length:426 start_codon:yes stop_codon:yes gene_type:complete
VGEYLDAILLRAVFVLVFDPGMYVAEFATQELVFCIPGNMVLKHYRHALNQREHSVEISAIFVVPGQPSLLVADEVGASLEHSLRRFVAGLRPCYTLSTGHGILLRSHFVYIIFDGIVWENTRRCPECRFYKPHVVGVCSH